MKLKRVQFSVAGHNEDHKHSNVYGLQLYLNSIFYET